jgi:hypothetical protein
MQAHLRTCPGCQSAQDDFLLLRRQLASYQTQATPFSQQQALHSILADGSNAAAPRASTSQRLKDAATRPRLLDSLSLIFAPSRLTPARMSAVALVLFSIFLGLFVYLKSHDGPSPAGSAQSNKAPANLKPSPFKDQELASGGMGQQRPAIQPEENAGEHSTGEKGRRASLAASRVARRVEIARERRTPAVRDVAREGNLVPGAAPGDGALSSDIAEARKFELAPPAGDPEMRTARYVEQAQLLLRSFRNARPGETGPAFDVAHEKERSQKLLYQNIVFRREAASTGNVPVEKLLSSLEPILIDIANLPDNPAQDDVRSIRERMQRKNIVAILQVNSASARRSN